MHAIAHIFFDLDHTLWDFEENSKVTLMGIFNEVFPEASKVSIEEFLISYASHNRKLWDLYHQHKIEKEELRFRRFADTFQSLQLNQDPHWWSDTYLDRMPLVNQLFPGAIQTLDYLKPKYSMSLITNGFKEVQRQKATRSGLEPYFQAIHISEEIGFQKPHPQIYKFALEAAGVDANKSIMVGDNFEADVIGAVKAGISAVWFNPEGLNAPDLNIPFHEIRALDELKKWL